MLKYPTQLKGKIKIGNMTIKIWERLHRYIIGVYINGIRIKNI